MIHKQRLAHTRCRTYGVRGICFGVVDFDAKAVGSVGKRIAVDREEFLVEFVFDSLPSGFTFALEADGGEQVVSITCFISFILWDISIAPILLCAVQY